MRQFLRQYATYSIGIALNRVAVLLLLPLYTRYLTPADYGVLDILMTFVALLQPLLIVGIDTAVQILYYDARTIANRSQNNLVITGVALVAACAGTIALLGILGASLVATLLFGSDLYVFQLQLLCIDTFIMCLFKLFHDNLRLREQPVLYSLLPLIQLIIMTVLNVYFIVVQGLGVIGYVWGLLIADATVMLLAGVLVLPRYRSGKPSHEHLGALLRIGLPLLPVSLAYWVLNLSDRFFLIRLAAAETVGVYGIAYRLATAISIFTLAMQIGWRPFALRAQHLPNSRATYALMPIYYFAVVGWIGLLVAELSPVLLRLFTSPAYFGAAELLTPLLLTQVVYGGYFILSTGIEITKRTYHITWIIILAAGVNVFFNVLLIPSLAAFGASLATAGSYLVAAFIVAIVSQSVYPLPYDKQRMTFVCIILLISYAGMTLNFRIGLTMQPLIGLLILVVSFMLLGWLLRQELHQAVEYLRSHLQNSKDANRDESSVAVIK